MDRISATLTGQLISGYVREYNRRDGSKGESVSLHIIRPGRNAPEKLECAPVIFAGLEVGQSYDFLVLISARASVALRTNPATGMQEQTPVASMNLWILEATNTATGEVIAAPKAA